MCVPFVSGTLKNIVAVCDVMENIYDAEYIIVEDLPDSHRGLELAHSTQ